MEFRKIIEDLGNFQTIMMATLTDNPELSKSIETFSNNLHIKFDEVCMIQCVHWYFLDNFNASYGMRLPRSRIAVRVCKMISLFS